MTKPDSAAVMYSLTVIEIRSKNYF